MHLLLQSIERRVRHLQRRQRLAHLFGSKSGGISQPPGGMHAAMPLVRAGRVRRRAIARCRRRRSRRATAEPARPGRPAAPLPVHAGPPGKGLVEALADLAPVVTRAPPRRRSRRRSPPAPRAILPWPPGRVEPTALDRPLPDRLGQWLGLFQHGPERVAAAAADQAVRILARRQEGDRYRVVGLQPGQHPVDRPPRRPPPCLVAVEAEHRDGREPARARRSAARSGRCRAAPPHRASRHAPS